MKTHIRSQAGIVLLTSLIMLVIMTLLVLSMVRTSVIELKIGGASQVAAQTRANAEAAIWAVLNNANNKGRFAHGTIIDVNLSDDYVFTDPRYKHLADVTLTATELACIEDAATGRGNTLARTWDVAYFDIEADSRDARFAGRSVVHQGIRSTIPKDGCK